MQGRVLARLWPARKLRAAPRVHVTAGLVQRWARLGATAAVIALAIASSLAWLAPLPGGDPTYQYVIDSYKRSAANGGTVDLAIPHPAGIRAWVKGQIGINVPIREVPAASFALCGVRIDHLGGANAAALVYRAGATEIDLFEWPDEVVHRSEVMTDQVGAYSVAHWSTDGVQYWAVTSTHDKSVVDFSRLVQVLNAPATTLPATAP
jgi:anti-sigma factor RsiW